VLEMNEKLKRNAKIIEIIAGAVIDKVLDEIDNLFSNLELEEKIKKMVAA